MKFFRVWSHIDKKNTTCIVFSINLVLVLGYIATIHIFFPYEFLENF